MSQVRKRMRTKMRTEEEPGPMQPAAKKTINLTNLGGIEAGEILQCGQVISCKCATATGHLQVPTASCE